MVELGGVGVPTYRNRVVIFYFYLSFLVIHVLCFIKNHNTVAVGGHPNPTYLHHAVISPAAGSRIVGLKIMIK